MPFDPNVPHLDQVVHGLVPGRRFRQLNETERQRVLHRCLGRHDNVEDTREVRVGDLRDVFHDRWLEDNVINAYMGLIMTRSEHEWPRVYVFSTFFMPRLCREGPEGAMNIYRVPGLNIFNHDLVLVPVHTPNHWSLAVST